MINTNSIVFNYQKNGIYNALITSVKNKYINMIQVTN